MKTIARMTLLVAVTITLLSSCNKQAKEQTARVKFNITDAPAQFDALNIDISSIQVHTEANGWVTLQSSLGVINILEYVNGETAVIAEGEIAAGNIDRIRLVLGSSNSVVANGVTTMLENTSELQSRLNIALNTNLQANGNYEWTIDFDAVQSVVATASGQFEFTPTIRLVVNPIQISTTTSGTGSGSTTGGINTSGSGSVSGSTSGSITVIESGSGTSSGGGSVVVDGMGTGNISGSISSAIGLASVCVTGSDGACVCTMTDATGRFAIQAISSGTCSIKIDPVLPLLSTHTISNINVTAGQTTNIGLIAF